jgi:hypothetical protein
MDDLADQTRSLLETGDSLELTLVELIVAVSECTEDESELCDLLDGLIETGRVRLQAAAREAGLRQIIPEAMGVAS